jgi:hypothetical protein
VKSASVVGCWNGLKFNVIAWGHMLLDIQRREMGLSTLTIRVL